MKKRLINLLTLGFLSAAPMGAYAEVNGILFTAKEIAAFDADYILAMIDQLIVKDGNNCRLISMKKLKNQNKKAKVFADISFVSKSKKHTYSFDNILGIEVFEDAESIYVDTDEEGVRQLKECLKNSK